MRRLLTSAASALLTGLIACGCGTAGGSSGASTAKQAQRMAASAQTTAAIASLALEASLHEADAANYAALAAPITVTPTGDPSSGDVTLDFGAGVEVNNADVSGTVVATYVNTGSTVTVTVTFANLLVDTQANGPAQVSGTVTLVATTSGSSATSSLSGTLVFDSAKDDMIVTQSMTVTVDGTDGSAIYTGTTSVVSDRHGTWTATYTSVETTLSASNRVIDTGTLTLVRVSGGTAVTAVFVFTGANIGLLTVTPPGLVSINFEL